MFTTLHGGYHAILRLFTLATRSRVHSDMFTTTNETYSETYAQIQLIMQVSYIYGKFSLQS